jgi:hypothetical protein
MWPLAADAEQPRRIGVLMGLENPQTKKNLVVFGEAFRSLGWFDGQTIQIEYRAAPDPDGLRSSAVQLLSQQPDLMVTVQLPRQMWSDKYLRTCGSYSLAFLIQSGRDL